ncbi:unknown [Paraprevotella clara CAG:116]|nr:unknown [Paraprevotella clara CAG:116]
MKNSMIGVSKMPITHFRILFFIISVIVYYKGTAFF